MQLKIDIWKIYQSWRYCSAKKILFRIGSDWNFRTKGNWKSKVKALIGLRLEKNIIAWIAIDGKHEA